MLIQARITATFLKQVKPAARPFEVADTELTGFILRVQPSGSMSYLCQYARGKRVTIGKTTKLKPEQARERAKDLLADAVKGVDHQAEKKKAKAENFGQFLDDLYVPYSEANHKSPRATLDPLRKQFKQFHNRKLSDIRPADIDRWRIGRLKEVSQSTVNREVTALKACLNKAVMWELIKENPLRSVKRPQEDIGEARFLTPEEERRLRDALTARDERIRAERRSANEWRRARGYDLMPDFDHVAFVDHMTPMILVSLNTGLRFGELTKLAWSRVDLAGGALTVAATTSKAGKTRFVPLNREARTALVGWRAQCGDGALVFASVDGNPFDNVKSAWRGITKSVGLDSFRWHDLRHSFASKLVQRGVNLSVVRELLGHSDFKLTQRYARLSDANKVDAVAVLDEPQ